jgi:LacI family transcriptional regulator
MTIDEIAALADVSKTTVSRVINDKPDVSPKTRDRILALIEEHSFTPNALAKAIISSKSENIGLIIPYAAQYIFSNPFYVEVLRGISTQISERGYYLMLCYLKDHNYLNIYKQSRVDGYILLSPGSSHSGLIDELIGAKAPFIATARVPELEKEMPWVDVDHCKPAEELTQYLISLGHRRIAYVGKATISSSRERLKGYRSALEKNGISYDERLIKILDEPTLSAGHDAALELMREAGPTAMFFASDLLAIGGLNAMHECHLQVPEDISIVGFDDIPLSAHLSPALTTVHQPAFEKGYRAASIFIDYLETGVQMKSELLDTQLVIRKSAAPPKWMKE